MASRKPRTSQPGQPRQGRPNLPFEIPFGLHDASMDSAMDDFLGGDDDMNDEDLEAELNALMSGSDIRSRPPRAAGVSPQPARGAPSPQARQPTAPPRRSKGSTPNPALVPPVLVNFDLKDIEKMGHEGTDDEEDIDEDDPELLAELADLSADEADEAARPAAAKATAPRPAALGAGQSPLVALLLQRLENYEGARQEALDAKEAGKVRRYERAIQTLKEQVGEAKKGGVVSEEDIPPAVFVKSVLQKPLADSKPFPSEPANLAQRARTPQAVPPEPPKEAPPAVPPRPAPAAAAPKKEESLTVLTLRSRREEYRHAALEAKRAGNKKDAFRFMTIAKQFDEVMEAAEKGEELDLSEMPPPPHQLPPEPSSPPHSAPDTLRNTPVKPPPAAAADDDIPEIDPSDAQNAFHAPDAPKSVLEALQQRLHKYTATAAEAHSAGDASRARRMQRIVKQYQEAIKDHQARRPVDFGQLPTPPGFGPIPTGGPSLAGRPVAGPPAGQPAARPAGKPAPAAGRPAAAAAGHASSRESRNEQQSQFINTRYKQLKLAALKAKKEGALETARHYLRQAKGLEPMIEASANGLPVDLNAVPKAPPGFATNDAADGFEVVQYEEAGASRPAGLPGSRGEVYTGLEKELVEQVGMCMRNAQHFKKAGDIPMSERFEQFNQHARKDLEALRNAFKHGRPVPLFHYETRAFSVVKCCAELPDNILEFTIIRGFGYTLSGFAPSDFTTYVKWDFPFPAEAPQSKATQWIKGTNEPDYNATFNININRKSRSLARIFKTKGITCEVIVKMGFLKADKVLATVTVPLEALESVCVQHASFSLMSGKSAAGGKLEVRARLREPLLKQQLETLKEKWLVIDQFPR